MAEFIHSRHNKDFYSAQYTSIYHFDREKARSRNTYSFNSFAFEPGYCKLECSARAIQSRWAYSPYHSIMKLGQTRVLRP